MDTIRRLYATATHIYLPVTKTGGTSQALGADWTPAAGDVQLIKDGGAAASIGTLPTAIATAHGALWDFSLTTTEMTSKITAVVLADATSKAVVDDGWAIETYGNPAALHPGEFIAPSGLDVGAATDAYTLAQANTLADRLWDTFLASNNTDGTFGAAVNALAAAGLTVPTVWSRVLTQPSGALHWSGNPTAEQALAYVLMKLLNKQAHRGTEVAWRNEADSGDITTAPVTRPSSTELDKGHDV